MSLKLRNTSIKQVGFDPSRIPSRPRQVLHTDPSRFDPGRYYIPTPAEIVDPSGTNASSIVFNWVARLPIFRTMYGSLRCSDYIQKGYYFRLSSVTRGKHFEFANNTQSFHLSCLWVVDNSRKTERCHGNTTSKYLWVTWPVVRVSFAKNSQNLSISWLQQLCVSFAKNSLNLSISWHQQLPVSFAKNSQNLSISWHQQLPVSFAVNPLNLSNSWHQQLPVSFAKNSLNLSNSWHQQLHSRSIILVERIFFAIVTAGQGTHRYFLCITMTPFCLSAIVLHPKSNLSRSLIWASSISSFSFTHTERLFFSLKKLRKTMMCSS